MLFKRVIPCLLISGGDCYKTINFKKRKYIGDVINSVRLFNDLGADELVILDIDATKNSMGPNIELISDIASECFMPLTYGGGIRSQADAESLLRLGVEKISINNAILRDPSVLDLLVERFGSSTIVVSVNVKKDVFGRKKVYDYSRRKFLGVSVDEYVKEISLRGCGEILFTDVDREGTQKGFDTRLCSKVAAAVDIPVVVNGGCGSFDDIVEVMACGITAVACGSKFVYNGPHNAVLINYLTDSEYQQINPT